MDARWFNWFDFWYAMDYFIWVTYELYLIQHACTNSWNEIKELFSDYQSPFNDIDILWFNLFYNGGSILKSITNLILYFFAKDYTRVKDAFTFGMEMGQIFWLLFFPVEDYLEDALRAGAVWGMDYTWDQVITLEVPGGEEKEVPVIGTYDSTEDNREKEGSDDQ